MAAAPPYDVVLSNNSAGNPDYTLTTGTTAHHVIVDLNALTATASPPLTGTQYAAMRKWQKAQKGEYAPEDSANPTLLYDYSVVVSRHGAKVPIDPLQVGPGVTDIPGVGGLVTAAKTIGDFITALFSMQLWIRVAEVAIGLLLLGVGLAHLSEAAGNQIKKAPVYRKVIK